MAATLQNLSIGLVIGALSVTMSISLAALVYGGAGTAYLARGIGLVLLGGTVLSVVVSLVTSLPGMIANAQDAPAAVLGALTASLGAQLLAGGASAEERFFTTVVVVAASTFATGALFLLFGIFRLGNLVRYLPYPVLGGFMAGTGWLLVTGGVDVMADVRPSLHFLTDLFASGVIIQWLPGAALAVALLVLTRRYKHFLVWPVALVAAVLVFYAVMFVAGGTLAGWRDRGLLLGSLPAGSLIAPPTAAEVALVRWDLVLAHLPTVMTVAFIALMALLLNAIGVEKSTGRKVHLNRELRAAGMGNLLAGSLGGNPGYQGLSFTTFNLTAGTGSRTSALVAAGVMVATLLFGADAIGLLPKAVVGGLVMFFGLKFLFEWLYQAFFNLPVGEYLIVVVILAVIVVAGVLPGVGVGLLLTVALFVVSSSRIDAVRYAVGGGELHSRVSRSEAERRQLDRHGHELMVVQLQGFLFFGTASALLERLERRVKGGPRLHSLIIDFSRVTGVDSTGLATIGDVAKLATAAGFELALCAVPGPIEKLLSRRRAANLGRHFTSLDEALEHAEERLLERLAVQRTGFGTEVDAVAYYSDPTFDFAALMPYLTRHELRAGDVLIRKGDEANVLYFLMHGQMTALAEGEGGAVTRFETLRAGGLLGELGFYLGGERSATVRADYDSVLLALDNAALERVLAAAPTLAAELHKQVARLMARRVLHLMEALEAVQR